jgi:hypothetical protein
LIKLIDKRDLNGLLEIRLSKLVEPILSNITSPDPHPVSASISSSYITLVGPIARNEVSEDGHPNVEGNGERNVIEDTQAR